MRLFRWTNKKSTVSTHIILIIPIEKNYEIVYNNKYSNLNKKNFIIFNSL